MSTDCSGTDNLDTSYHTSNVTEDIANSSYVCSVNDWTLDLAASVIGTVGIFGNVAFIIVVCRIPYMRNATNYFLISLAVSDLLYLLAHTLCRPDWYRELMWMFDTDNKKILACVRWGSTTPAYSTSILSVMFISIERYLAICKPFTRQSRGLKKPSRVVFLVFASWLFGATIGLSGLLECYTDDPGIAKLIMNYTYTLVEAVLFLISMVVVLVLYTIAARRLKMSTYDITYSPTNIRDRSQVMRLCIVTAAVYFTCIFPRIMFQLAAFYDLLDNTMSIFGVLSCLNEVTIVVLMFNSAVNPIIYNATSTKYRNAFFTTITCSPVENLARTSSDRRSISRTRQTSLDYRQVRNNHDSRIRRAKETPLRSGRKFRD
ncbi:neuromedin-U receptor 2-like [Saccoglossus kowalevskii]|uniref:Neuromedin-U receptor 2-like n=1 Tax=Saccoglossus kowalevskii TaxID=10224 RepID=A0ABM0MLB1_SACKO|nr:PREDICTED: neuromedin-U receptor 2-like [Saccoglossus kowalevskii]